MDLLFEPFTLANTATSQQVLADLTCLWNLLGKPRSFPFYVVDVQLSPMAEFARIASLPKGKPATGQLVSDALRGKDPLFKFGKYSVTKVGGWS